MMLPLLVSFLFIENARENITLPQQIYYSIIAGKEKGLECI